MPLFKIAAAFLLIALFSPILLPDAAAQPKDPAPVRDTEIALKKALLDVARKTYEHEARLRPAAVPGSSAFAPGSGAARGSASAVPSTTNSIALWSQRWLEAQLDLADAKAERIAAYRDHFRRMQDLEHRMTLLIKSGMASANDSAGAAYFRIQAELWLEQARAK